MTDKKKKLLKDTAIIIHGILAYGLIVYKFWRWFIIPVFHASAINYAAATGLWVCIALLKPGAPAVKEEFMDKDNEPFRIASPYLLLLIGWSISLFV